MARSCRGRPGGDGRLRRQRPTYFSPSTAGRSSFAGVDACAMFVRCVGDGRPTVVPVGGVVADWSAVQAGVEPTTRVCSYDKPNTKGSRIWRSLQQRVADLVPGSRLQVVESAGHDIHYQQPGWSSTPFWRWCGGTGAMNPSKREDFS